MTTLTKMYPDCPLAGKSSEEGVAMSTSKIWKFELEPGEQSLRMPRLENIVHAGPDGNNNPCLWAQVNHDSNIGHYRFNVVATGEEFDSEKWVHCKTWAQGVLIWHLLRIRYRTGDNILPPNLNGRP